MNRVGLIAMVAALAAASAFAQQTFEPAVPKGIPDARVEPSGELKPPAALQPVAPQLVMNRARGGNEADARQCLQLGSNRQIHRCAERYLPREARVRQTRARVAKAADPVRATDRAASVDIGKADLSRAAAPAKPVDMGKPASAPPVRSADVVKPAPAAGAPAQPKWTDTAKGLVKSQGDRLQEK